MSRNPTSGPGLAVTAALLAFAPAVYADGMGGETAQLLGDSGFYARAEGGLTWSELPKLDSLGSINDDGTIVQGEGELNSFTIDGAGWTAGGTLGVRLDIEGLTNARAEIGFRYGETRASNGSTETCRVICDFLYVDGTGVPLAIFAGPGVPFETRVRGEARMLEIPLSLMADLDRFDTGLGPAVLTGSIGALYGRIEQGYRITASTAANTHTLSEDVETDFIGPTVGASLAIFPTDDLSVTFGGSLAGLYVDSAFEARQDTPYEATRRFTAAEDSARAFGMRGSLGLGLQLDLGGILVGAQGSATYLSHVARIDNPSAAPGSVVFPTVPGRTNAASIDYDDMLSFGGLLRVTVPF